jgi:hypothetical protein
VKPVASSREPQESCRHSLSPSPSGKSESTPWQSELLEPELLGVALGVGVAGEAGSVEVVGCSACLEELAIIRSGRRGCYNAYLEELATIRNGRTTAPWGALPSFHFKFPSAIP